MNIRKNALLAAVGLVMACAAATGASAETSWNHHHPRQAEVLGRVAHQERRITVERRQGELTMGQAHRLRREDARIARQDRRDAFVNRGFITRAQQRHLNREENGASGQIGAGRGQARGTAW